MKCFRFLSFVAFIFLFLTGMFNANAQTQSFLLPFPGSTSPTGPCMMINFSDNANPVITELPSLPFSYLGQNGDPHDENQLMNTGPTNPNSNYEYLFEEVYLGQHPKYAQSVVHDKHGNLLFFILDNNIYNRRGKAFLDDMASPQGLLNGDYSFAGSNVISGGSQINTYDFNRFNTGVLLNNISLDPEIVIFPLNSRADCYTYGVLFSVYDYDANSSVRS